MPTDQRQPELRTATLGEITERLPSNAESVTAIIHQTIKPDAMAAYELWLKKIVFPSRHAFQAIVA